MPRRLAAWLVWPVVMAGSLAAVWWGLARGWSTALWAFAVSTGTFLLILLIERLLPNVDGSTLFRDRQAPNDIAHGIAVGGLGRPLAEPVTAALVGLFVTMHADSGAERGGGIWPHQWPMAPQVALGLALWSFPSYWTHRWFHRVGRLWWFHALHHDPVRMQVLKGNRIHVGEDFLRNIAMLLPLLALGAPGRVLLWIAMWNNSEGALAHSNIVMRFPRFAHYVLATPANHRVHHSSDRALQDANFAGVAPVWDVVFGTYRHPDRHLVHGFGLGDETVPTNFLAQLALPFRASPSAAMRPGPSSS